MDKYFLKFLKEHKINISEKSVEVVLELSKAGGTVPFIARYRKEKTGNLDEVQIRQIIDFDEKYTELIKRKTFVLEEIKKQGNLTAELQTAVDESLSLAEVEEIYRPYKRKKKTKATVARDAGLSPLSDWIWSIGQNGGVLETSLEVKAKEFLNPKAGFVTYDEVLLGARDIIVEKVSNEKQLRDIVREQVIKHGDLVSKAGKKYQKHSKYENYTEYKESISQLLKENNSHRYLAVKRGWNEGELVVSVEVDQDVLFSHFYKFCNPKDVLDLKNFFTDIAKTSLSVYILPSIVNESHKLLTQNADEYAIKVFAQNVKKILLSSPFGAKCVLGVDPGLRTGCKLALVDDKGQFISHTVMYVQGDNSFENAKKLFDQVTKQIKIQAVAVGNGTGGREAEAFVRKILSELKLEIPVVLISESGASIYSASDIARKEFPNLDLTIRGAISIARRLQDPLAELVKLDPKSIGVGQYQHDVSQSSLKKKLKDVVESCVNTVGVDINTASSSLLEYVSGIGPAIASNIVEHREKNGLFNSRQELMNVKTLSNKAFEQAAGFLRVKGAVYLDRTGIHPERYQAVRDMASELKLQVSEVVGANADKILENRSKWAKLVGEYTFEDIYKELKQPGRDPRDSFKAFKFRDDISDIKDLKTGMKCSGIVTNVTNFGAFVDIGVHQNGLVHKSEMARQFVDDPQKIVSPGDQVQVEIIKLDLDKNQIQLSMTFGQKQTAPNSSNKKASAGSNSKSKKFDPKSKRPSSAARGKGASGRPNQPRGQRPQRRHQSNPFNNAFSALSDLNLKK